MRALIITSLLVLSSLLCACGGGDDDQQSDQPDKTIGPVQCAASATACHALS